MEQIKIKLNGGMMPKKATPFDAAYDVYVPEDTDIKIGRQRIDLKFSAELPHGTAALMRARSGYSLEGVEAYAIRLDSDKEEKVRIDADVITGLCDEKYRGNYGVLLNVHFLAPLWAPFYYRRVYLKKGTRIAQMQIVAVPDTEIVAVAELDMTNDRGGGFGHTNK